MLRRSTVQTSGPKGGGLRCLLWGKLGTRLTQCGL